MSRLMLTAVFSCSDSHLSHGYYYIITLLRQIISDGTAFVCNVKQPSSLCCLSCRSFCADLFVLHGNYYCVTLPYVPQDDSHYLLEAQYNRLHLPAVYDNLTLLRVTVKCRTCTWLYYVDVAFCCFGCYFVWWWCSSATIAASLTESWGTPTLLPRWTGASFTLPCEYINIVLSVVRMVTI